MGKRAPTIGTLLALTFLCSLLALALVGGGVRPSLERIEPLPGEAQEGELLAPLPPSSSGFTAPIDKAIELVAFTSEDPGPPGGKKGGVTESEEAIEDEPPVEPEPTDSGGAAGGDDGQDDEPQPDGRPEHEPEGRRRHHEEARPRIREDGRTEAGVLGHTPTDPVGGEVDSRPQDQDRNLPR